MENFNTNSNCFTKKRKHENDGNLYPEKNKHGNIFTNPVQDSSDYYQNQPNIEVFKTSADNSDIEENKQKYKHFKNCKKTKQRSSANKRMANLRNLIESSKNEEQNQQFDKSPCTRTSVDELPPVTRNLSQPKFSNKNQEANLSRFSKKSNSVSHKNATITTATPSSLEERLNKIKGYTTLSNFTNPSPGTGHSFTQKSKPNKACRSNFERQNNSFKSKNTSNTGSQVQLTSAIVFNKPNIEEFKAKSTVFTSPWNTESNPDHFGYEIMDWSDDDELATLQNLQDLRLKMICDEDIMSTPQTAFQRNVVQNTEEISNNTSLLKDIYIVVDTNVFISHLNIISEILNIKINAVVQPIIMIPWMVIQELDYMKDGRSGEKLKRKAASAVGWINSHLSMKESKIKGQSIQDANMQQFTSTNADDAVLNCCLQIDGKNHRAILLSNDVNLRNKALMHGIASYGHSKILNELQPNCYPSSTSPIPLKTPSHFRCMLTYVMDKVLSDTYGQIIWDQMKKMNSLWKEQPLPLKSALQLIIKYWQSVFGTILQKQCLKVVEDFQEYIKFCKDDDPDDEKSQEFKLSMCMFLKNGLPLYKNVIDDYVSKNDERR